MDSIVGMLICIGWGVNVVFVLGLHSKANEYEHYSVIKGGLFFGFTFGLLSMRVFDMLLEIVMPQVVRWWYGLSFEKGPIIFACVLTVMVAVVIWAVHKLPYSGKQKEGGEA